MANIPEIIVGISGGSGSGKTTLLSGIRSHFPEGEVCVISQDDYYRPIEELPLDDQGYVNFDLPMAIDQEAFKRDLRSLKSGGDIQILKYQFNNPEKTEPEYELLSSARILIVEGLFVLHFNALWNILDMEVYVHASPDLRKKRRLVRDMKERGMKEGDILYQWDNHVMPAYKNYLEPYKHTSDLIVDNNQNLKESLEQLYHGLVQKLK